MKLREILELKPGTLIKGLFVDVSGAIRFNLNGWDVRHRKIIDSVHNVGFPFVYYDDERVSNLIKKGKIEVYKPGKVEYSVLRKNGQCYYKDIKHWFRKEETSEGECLGMSLGKSFIAIQPTQADMYRPDFYEIYVFHKMLHGEKTKWIVLQSKTQYKGLLIIDPDQVLLDIHMNLL
jgi:hypothetical protein